MRSCRSACLSSSASEREAIGGPVHCACTRCRSVIKTRLAMLSRRLPTMISPRRFGGRDAAVGLFAAITAVQMALVVFGNITDYGTNHAFVMHVLSMDTTFRSPNVMWRAITDPALVTATYVAIIAWEALTAVVLIAATAVWIRALGTGRSAAVARGLSSVGWLLWTALFGGGFLAVGGEWFQMWQSSDWNGLDTALRYLIVGSVGLILLHLPGSVPDREPASTDDAHRERPRGREVRP